MIPQLKSWAKHSTLPVASCRMRLPNLAREIIAERIIGAAKRGERDPKRLCDIGVATIRPSRKPDRISTGSGNQSQIAALSD